MSKIIHYRNNCIGCGICFELQPEIWRMSKKDGKACLVKAEIKKGIYVLPVSNPVRIHAEKVALACPVKIIKVI